MSAAAATGRQSGSASGTSSGVGAAGARRRRPAHGGPVSSIGDAELARIQEALGVVARRAKDLSLHEALGQRVGYPLEGPYYSTLARLGLASPCTVSELAAGLGLELSTVSRRVKALEERGLVQRHIDPDDRRVSHLELTPAGRAMFDALSTGWREMLAEALADWDDADLAAFTHLFARFAADLDRYGDGHT